MDLRERVAKLRAGITRSNSRDGVVTGLRPHLDRYRSSARLELGMRVLGAATGMASASEMDRRPASFPDAPSADQGFSVRHVIHHASDSMVAGEPIPRPRRLTEPLVDQRERAGGALP